MNNITRSCIYIYIWCLHQI